LIRTEIHKICLYSEILNGNYDKAKEHLTALGSKVNQEIYLNLLDILQHPISEKISEDQVVNIPIEAVPATTNEELLTLDLVVEDIEKLEDTNLQLNPKLIHQYFQQKKQNALKQGLEEKVKSNEFISWNYNNETYSTKNKDLYKIDGKEDFYVIIDPKLVEKLDQSQLEQYTHAITKGLVSKAQYSVGIKFTPIN
jgi:hypothetical protein